MTARRLYLNALALGLPLAYAVAMARTISRLEVA
jgi:hypothetical protein